MTRKQKIGWLIGTAGVLAASWYGGPIAGKAAKETVLPTLCKSDVLASFCSTPEPEPK